MRNLSVPQEVVDSEEPVVGDVNQFIGLLKRGIYSAIYDVLIEEARIRDTEKLDGHR